MLAKSAANTVLNEALLMLGMHAWIFHQFILSCDRYCFLDISHKVFANGMFGISPGHFKNIFDTIMTNTQEHLTVLSYDLARLLLMTCFCTMLKAGFCNLVYISKLLSLLTVYKVITETLTNIKGITRAYEGFGY